MRSDLLEYYERELELPPPDGSRVRRQVPENRLAPAARAGQVRGPARRAAPRGVRVPRGARAPQDRRRVPRDHGIAPRNPVSDVPRSRALDVRRPVRPRFRAGELADRTGHSERRDARVRSRRRASHAGSGPRIRSPSGRSKCAPLGSSRRPRSRSKVATRGRCFASTCTSWERPRCPSSSEKSVQGVEHPLSKLRFYLQGEGKVVHSLYERSSTTRCPSSSAPIRRLETPRRSSWGPEALRPVGFGEDETLLPTPDRLFRGYRVLQEYFSFPEKFLFVDLEGLERRPGKRVPDTLDVRILLGRPFAAERSVSAQTFRLHATPIVNLFSQMAEPIRVST